MNVESLTGHFETFSGIKVARGPRVGRTMMLDGRMML